MLLRDQWATIKNKNVKCSEEKVCLVGSSVTFPDLAKEKTQQESQK